MKMWKVKEILIFQMMMMVTARRRLGVVSEAKVDELQKVARVRDRWLRLPEGKKARCQMMNFLLRIQMMRVMRILGQGKVHMVVKTAIWVGEMRLGHRADLFARSRTLKAMKVKKLKKAKIKSPKRYIFLIF